MSFINILFMGLVTILKIIINPIYWIMMIFIGFQYKRLYKIEKKILGVNKINFFENLIASSVMGLLGGLIASILIIILGITIDINGFKYLLIISLLLVLIDIRFICFAYSGGIISLISIIFGFPKINISNILAIVAILHIVESILIYIDGDSFKIPLIIEKDGIDVGGFNIMRLWPLPFSVLIFSNNGFVGPDWWNLFNVHNGGYLLYFVIGVVGALGYGDIAISNYPKEKIKKSSFRLLIYSITLLIITIISVENDLFKYIAIIFSPIGHELVIYFGKKDESKNIPKLMASDSGVKILDILPNSIAEKLGLETGDILLYINDEYINDKVDIIRIFTNKPRNINIKYLDRYKNIKKSYISTNDNYEGLGALIIPKNNSYSFVFDKTNIFSKLIKALSKSK